MDSRNLHQSHLPYKLNSDRTPVHANMYNALNTREQMKQDLGSKRKKLSAAVDEMHSAATEVTAKVKDEIAAKKKSILTNEIANRTPEDALNILEKEADSVKRSWEAGQHFKFGHGARMQTRADAIS